MEALLGHTPQQAIGQSIDLIIPTPLHAWHWRGFDKAVGTGVLHKPGATVKVPALHRDGTFVAIKGEIGLTTDADGAVSGAEVTNVRTDARWMSALWRPVVALVGLAGRVGLRPRSANPKVD
ncbi:MAG: PAS domain-containing protein [Aeromicrobium sp.]